ncbi:MAG: DUF4340 domain-containing protein [Pseudomonadota bacterium]|nr:DUF4340 domain-containing protein [Pseudomonadota bacterium]
MRRTTWIALLVVTIIFVVASVLVLRQQADRLAAVEYGEALFPGLDTRINDVAELEITTTSDHWTLTRDADGTWRHAARGGYPADVDRIKQAVVALSRASVVEPKTSDPAKHARLELVPPTGDAPKADDAPDTVELVARDATGKDVAALLLGKIRRRATAKEPAHVYVRRVGEDQSWLAEARFDIHHNPAEWLDKTLFKVTKDEVTAIEITHPGGEVTRIAGTGGVFHLDAVPEGRVEQEFRLTAAGRALEFLRFRDVKPVAEVDMTGATTGTWRTADGLVVTVRAKPAGFKSEGDDAVWATFELSVDESAAGTPAEKPEADKAEGAAKAEGDTATAETPMTARQRMEKATGIVTGWAYLFPKFSADNFMPSLETLTKPKEES